MKNVPEIRFKGFEEEWKTYILSSIGNFRSNGVDKKIYNDEQIVNLLNYMDVYNYRKITSKNCIDLMKVSATKKQIKDCNIIKGDIFFTPSSETPDEIGYVMSIEETLPNTCYSYIRSFLEEAGIIKKVSSKESELVNPSDKIFTIITV